MSVLDKLCRYDERNPNYVADDDFTGEARTNCCCDSCFYGTDNLAVKILELEAKLAEVQDTIKTALGNGINEVAWKPGEHWLDAVTRNLKQYEELVLLSKSLELTVINPILQDKNEAMHNFGTLGLDVMTRWTIEISE